MRKSMIMLIMLCCMVFVGHTMACASDADYQIKNPLIQGRGSEMHMTWINPSVSTISSIKVYDVTADKTEVTFTPVTTSGGRNTIKLTGVSNASYKYLIEMSFTDHNAISYYFYGQFSNSNCYVAPPGWNLGSLPVKARISTEVEEDGNTALRLQTYRLSGESGYLSIDQNIPQELNKKYKLRIKYKTQEDPNFRVRLFWSGQAYADIKTKATEWTQYEIEFTPTSSSNSKLMFYIDNNISQNILIDDVELYKSDDDGVTWGSNLVYNGTFEEGYEEICSDVAQLTEEVGNGQLKISWENPEETVFMHSRVYIKDDEDLLLRAELSADESEITLTGLNNDEEYEIVVKAVDKYGRETEGVVLQAMPTAPDYEISDLFFYKFEEGTSASTEEITPGDMNCIFRVINNKLSDGMGVQSLVVMYNDEKTINKVFSSGSQTAWMGVPLPVECMFNVSEEDSYVEIYIWSSLTEMDILVPRKVYNVKK